MFEIEPTTIDGCYLVHPFSSIDDRGSFIKIFNSQSFKEKGLCDCFHEEYFSVSKKNVIRGMHFQLPPSDQCKLVYCLNGHVEDVIVDLRKRSSDYGKYAVFKLDSNNPTLIYMPRGIAHGFLAESDNAVMLYNVETIYDKAADAGILWNSFGYDWPCAEPVVSDRDRQHPGLSEFTSPF